jgi:hypothetical protein
VGRVQVEGLDFASIAKLGISEEIAPLLTHKAETAKVVIENKKALSAEAQKPRLAKETFPEFLCEPITKRRLKAFKILPLQDFIVAKICCLNFNGSLHCICCNIHKEVFRKYR